jgi:cell division protein FtsN
MSTMSKPKCGFCNGVSRRVRLARLQSGGTILGIVIGLVLGLGIAFAVTVYMKRTDLPFVKRDNASAASTGKPEAPKDPAQIPDPNESLYAKPKPPEKPALADVVPGKADEPAGVKPTESRNLNIDGGKPPAPAASADPLGQLAAKVSKSEPAPKPAAAPAPVAAAPAAAPAVDDGSRYLIQAGAFKRPEEAEGMRARLAILGFEAQVSQRETDAGTLHRVRIGPVANLDTTNRVRAKLSENGIDSSIIKIQ